MRLAIVTAVVLALPASADAAAKTWSITVCGAAPDSRRVAVDEAVAFWNATLASVGASLTLGPIHGLDMRVSEDVLTKISEGVLVHDRTPRLPREFDAIPGDVIIALSDAELISVGIPPSGSPSTSSGRGRRGLVVVRKGDIPPLSLPNVARNVLAHELGHVLGLPHRSDPALLMCGRPAPCRPAVFQTPDMRFFPLTDSEKRDLAKRFR